MKYFPLFSPRCKTLLVKSFQGLTLLSILISGTVLPGAAQKYTRGVGVYPGDPRENFAPILKIDPVHYRNLALDRPAYQSSAYDYNLTAQLVTDGIIDSTLPGWIVATTSDGGVLPRDGREHVLDRHPSSQQPFKGPDSWMQIEMAGNYAIPGVDSISLAGTLEADTLKPKPWEITVSGSQDGVKWDPLGKVNGDTLPGRDMFAAFLSRFRPPTGQKLTPLQIQFIRRFAGRNRRVFDFPFKLEATVNYRFYRYQIHEPNATGGSISDFGLFGQGKYAEIGGPYHFTSAWKSAGSGQEWIYVDLGVRSTLDQVKLFWIRPAVEGSVQVSDDAQSWKDMAPLPSASGNTQVIPFPRGTQGRYVRVLMTRPASVEDGYILSEMQVWGKGGLVPETHTIAPPGLMGRIDLAGGAWRLQRASLVKAEGTTISSPEFVDNHWLIATVPATSLVSYLNDGAIADPNYGDNQMLVSDSYFYSDFWYRDVFKAPPSYKGRKSWLHFNGINWEAEVYLNGHDLGSIQGAFIRGRFDVTGILVPGGRNVLAVKILKNDTPGFPTEQNRNSTDANGGQLGADNPTFHASIGWDWIPTVRGRNTGIWNKVYLTQSGPVTLQDPFVSAHLPLPDTTSADIRLEVNLQNHQDQKVTGFLEGQIGPVAFKKSVILTGSSTQTLVLDPSNTPALKLDHPRLWWPNGYGGQYRYPVRIDFRTSDGIISDRWSFLAGVREMTYSQEGGALRIWVNGRRFIPRGGNWGFAEDLLRYRQREYDIAVRYHKEMNFNMIRDWVGQVDDQAFYDACDRYGILIWQDFWLANPSDGPDPIHPEMFIANLKDYIKQIRNHPSIGLFVGRNEGNPPPIIETAIQQTLPQLDPGIQYIPNSAFGTVSGGGPYGLMPLKFYFQYRATPKLHSEMGMPAPVSYESLSRMMPTADIWPQSALWGLHDYTLQGAQNGGNFNRAIEEAFGKVNNMKEWLDLASWTAYQGYRAMFEAQSRNRMGLLIWMSHPSWPTMVWQTYDYYFEPTAAYFGARKGSEPLHIQWNPLSDSVEVVNYSVEGGGGLKASLQVLDLNGALKLHREATLNCPEDSTVEVFPLTLPRGLSPVYFIRLELTRGNELVSRNLYMRGLNQDSTHGLGDLKAVLKVPKVKLEVRSNAVRVGSLWKITTLLVNASPHPAFIVRLKVVGARSGNRILPVIFSDNFITLMPGEHRTIHMELQDADTAGQTPEVNVEGLNVE
ncbi:MAG TPA: discoidin domain-containing protein [Chitinophagaceae bacterium]|nr:discoidin domain-containing protein [Chitinophagaceae bacterium]